MSILLEWMLYVSRYWGVRKGNWSQSMSICQSNQKTMFIITVLIVLHHLISDRSVNSGMLDERNKSFELFSFLFVIIVSIKWINSVQWWLSSCQYWQISYFHLFKVSMKNQFKSNEKKNHFLFSLFTFLVIERRIFSVNTDLLINKSTIVKQRMNNKQTTFDQLLFEDMD